MRFASQIMAKFPVANEKKTFNAGGQIWEILQKRQLAFLTMTNTAVILREYFFQFIFNSELI